MIEVLENTVPLTGGLTFPDSKAVLIKMPLQKALLPKLIKLPLLQNTGLLASPIVEVGDAVSKGQLIAETKDNSCSPVYASTSGVVKEIAEYPLPESYDLKSTCIVIETDGEDKWLEQKQTNTDYKNSSTEELLNKIIQVGVAKLASKSFSYIKNHIAYTKQGISLLIINAAETEPFISCKNAVLNNDIDEIIAGIEILVRTLKVENCVIAIDESNFESIQFVEEALSKTNVAIKIELKSVPSHFPACEEKQLIKSICGKEIAAEELSVKHDVVVEDVSFALAVKKAVIDNEPLLSRVVTVTGPGINQACNIDVLIGTPINEVIDQCNGYSNEFSFLIIGGPMTGFKLYSDDAPVIETTNCILAADDQLNSINIKQNNCIRCDDCVPVCPVKLNPQHLHWQSLEQDVEQLNQSGLFDCIECGCCSYVCPSHIPLVAEYKQAKYKIRKQQTADGNKQRYLDKIARKERLEAEKLNRRQNKVTQDKDDEMKKRKDAIAAAVNRVRKKREEKSN